jgi:tRNA 2-selenouridine synthase
MPVNKISLAHAINLMPNALVIDVRSPAEFLQGHIPNAYNLPLFTNEERKNVGTAYKKESKQIAIKIGLKYFGPKLVQIVNTIELQLQQSQKTQIIVHCWRGGMRSGAIAWLLDLYGFNTSQIIGGYKNYRNWVLNQFAANYSFKILAGNTGSNKTYWLQAMANKGQTVINLEALANHKGSAFGHLGMPAQPSQEHFENLLATELYNKKDNNIWLEDESRRIGLLNIPLALWGTMRTMPIYFLKISFEQRLQIILKNYGHFNTNEICQAIERIAKRLGGLNTKNAIAHAREGNLEACFTILLHYYDAYYFKGLSSRPNYQALLTEIEIDFFDNL